MIDTRKQRMTRENTPSFPPLSEQQRTEAMAYIHKCETRKENFCNMESRIREYFVARTFNKFTHTFKEYIIYEIILYNLGFACPPRNVKEAYQARYRLFANRLECRRKCGATPKYHARILCNQINQLMIEEGLCLFWMFCLRKPAGMPLSNRDRLLVKEKKWFQAYLRKCKRQEERTKVKALEPQDSEQSIHAELMSAFREFVDQRMRGGIQDFREYLIQIGREDLLGAPRRQNEETAPNELPLRPMMDRIGGG
jgi:hypothetical protein